MIGNNFTVSSRDAWVSVPNNDINFTYDENGNPTQIDFLSNNVVIFTQLFTYNENGKPTSIKCINPQTANSND